MEFLPLDPFVRCLVFGRADSGKSTFAQEYCVSVLESEPESVVLYLATKTKVERKALPRTNESIGKRILYKWVHDKMSLLQAISELHLHTSQPLTLLVVEDIQEFFASSQMTTGRQIFPMIACICNAIACFPGCRLLVTLTPRQETPISDFRCFMTHYVNICADNRTIRDFKRNSAKSNEEIKNLIR